MKPREPSPWNRPHTPDGPRLVGDAEEASSATNPPPRVRPPAADLPTAPQPRAPYPRSGAPPRQPRNQSWFSRRAKPIGIAVGIGMVGLVAVLVGLFTQGGGDGQNDALFNVEDAARSVALVAPTTCQWSGSGSLVSSTGLVLTNSHVATDAGSDRCELRVGFADSYGEEPTEWFDAVVVVDDVDLDLAILQLLDDDGSPTGADGRKPIPINPSAPTLGDVIQTLGYPGIGGTTLTFTSGDFSGIDDTEAHQYYKTTASLNGGISGGSAFNGSFALIGVPTAVLGSDVDCAGDECMSFGASLGLIRPIHYAVDLIEGARELTR